MTKLVPWTTSDLIHATLLMIATGGIITGLLSITTLQKAIFGLHEYRVVPVTFIVLNGSIILIVWYFTLRKYDSRLSVLGLCNPILRQPFIKFGIPRSFLTLFVLPVSVLLLSILFTGLYRFVVTSVGWELLDPTNVDSSLIGYGNIRLANIIIIGLWAPFAEELFFRGFLLPGLVKSLGNPVGVLVGSLAFASAHLSLGSFCPIFVIGILLSLLYLFTRSIWPGLIVHSSQNTIVILMNSIY